MIHFKKTLKAVAELKNDEVVQVFHRGHEVKVMMTQDHFFNLMARLEKFENSGKTKVKD